MSTKPVHVRTYAILALYAGVVLTAYLYPMNTEETINHYQVVGIRGDYWLHMVLFFPLPFLVSPAGKGRKEWLALTLLCFCLAAVAEGIHYLVPYRSFNPFDMLANVTGVLLATACLTFQRIIRYAKK